MIILVRIQKVKMFLILSTVWYFKIKQFKVLNITTYSYILGSTEKLIVGFVPLLDFNLGDNLEQHAIGGFRRCWNSGLVCRRCTIKYDDLSSENGFLRHTPWSSLLHSEVNEGNECPLNQLHGFDATKNLPLDFMHDCCEGIVLLRFILSWCVFYYFHINFK